MFDEPRLSVEAQSPRGPKCFPQGLEIWTIWLQLRMSGTRGLYVGRTGRASTHQCRLFSDSESACDQYAIR
jgi:hypothetical protein